MNETGIYYVSNRTQQDREKQRTVLKLSIHYSTDCRLSRVGLQGFVNSVGKTGQLIDSVIVGNAGRN
jgi:hypothetical protein